MRRDAAKPSRVADAVAGLGAVLALAACGGAGGAPPSPPPARPAMAAGEVRVFEARPRVAVVGREGDPLGAAAAAVSTLGIGDGEVAALLAALVDVRLAQAGVEARLELSSEGYRVKVPVRAPASSGTAADALRRAMLEPVREAEVAPVAERAARAARRPVSGTLAVARCRGEVALAAPPAAPTAQSLEAARQRAHGHARVALGFAGAPDAGEVFAQAVAKGPAWPAAAPESATPATAAAPTAVQPSREIPVGAVRAFLTLPTASPRATVLAAEALGRARGALEARLGALETPATLREVTAAAHPRGGCLTVSFDLAAKDAAAAFAHAAPAIAAAEELMLAEERDAASQGGSALAVARRARSAEDAAERAAWWALVADGPEGPRAASVTLLVGAARDDGAMPSGDVDQALARARAALAKPVVDVRSRVERGQGELWVLFGSGCGTAPEVEGDAGYSAVAAWAAARHAPASHDDVTVEPFVAPDLVGLLVHGPARTGEAPTAHARRVAAVAGRLLTTGALDGHDLRVAHAELFRAAQRDDARAFAALAQGLAPGRPALLAPLGTAEALAGASDASLLARSRAILEGPLRAVVLANAEPAQADAAGRELDRWIPRRLDEVRACAAPQLGAPRGGTLASPRTAPGPAEAWIGAAVPRSREGRAAAVVLAAMLDGDGVLAAPLSGVVRERSARVVGGREASAIVVRLVAPEATLDAAVEKTRAALGQLRAGAFEEQAAEQAWQRLARAREARRADPAARLVELLADDAAGRDAPRPSLDQLKEQAKEIFRDDALVLVGERRKGAADAPAKR